MNKHVILSTDNNHEYYSLLPLVSYSWQKIGYDAIVYTVGLDARVFDLLGKYCCVINIDNVYKIRDATLAQLSRLFIRDWIFSDWTCITGDADMVMAKDIFTDEGDIVSYGWDLTDRNEIPICYVKATAAKWRELMGEFTIPETAYSNKRILYWGADQQLLTKRAKEYGLDKIKFIDRGIDKNNLNLPMGRWDRYNWKYIPKDIIDIHMPRNDWDAQIQAFKHLWPEDDYSFILKFKDELSKIPR